MTDTIKNSLWITCLVLVIAILCLFTYKVVTLDHDQVIQGAEVEAIIQEHRPHTHEHAGLACCPCGVCHKHDAGENENMIKEPAWWIRFIALGTFATVMMSAILGMFCG
jgi:ABC-type nickel/cobalt efflux system permease component RcnA